MSGTIWYLKLCGLISDLEKIQSTLLSSAFIQIVGGIDSSPGSTINHVTLSKCFILYEH